MDDANMLKRIGELQAQLGVDPASVRSGEMMPDVDQLLEHLDRVARPQLHAAMRAFWSYVERTNESALEAVEGADELLNSNNLSKEERAALEQIVTIGPLVALAQRLRVLAGLKAEPELFEKSLDRDAFRVAGGPWVPSRHLFVELSVDGERHTVDVERMTAAHGAAFARAFNAWLESHEAGDRALVSAMSAMSSVAANGS